LGTACTVCLDIAMVFRCDCRTAISCLQIHASEIHASWFLQLRHPRGFFRLSSLPWRMLVTEKARILAR
jgi:hypothetical protein